MNNTNILELLKKAGRANDSLVVHLSPESAALLKSFGGLETINPITELPEYWGWDNFVEIFVPVVFVAVAVFAPEVIPAIGTYLATGSAEATVAVLATDGSAAAVGGALTAAGVDASVATVSAAGAAATGATSSAVNTAAQGGSPEDIAKSAVVGGVSGGVGSEIGSAANAAAQGGMNATEAAAIGGAAKGAITPALTGGSVGAGAAGGALGSALGTEIGGDAGKIIGGATGSATSAALSGKDASQSALRGGLSGAAGALGSALKQEFNPATGQMETMQNTPTQPTPTTPPQPDVQQPQNYVGDFPEITVSGSPDLVLPDTGVASSDTSTTPNKATQAKQSGVQLISPTIAPSSSSGGSPQVLSSVLGAPSSTILGQALQSSNPDPSTTGSPILEGDDKNVRNVWNTESLRTALGL